LHKENTFLYALLPVRAALLKHGFDFTEGLGMTGLGLPGGGGVVEYEVKVCDVRLVIVSEKRSRNFR